MNIHELDSYDLGDAVKFNDRLNPRIWGADEKMRPEVREQLLRIADDFREFLGIDVEVKDITVSGSNAAYTYTPHSDIDLHLVVDLPKADADEVYRELFDAKKYAYNDMHDIKIGGYDVELYVQDANKSHISQGIYSVKNDDWISVPKRRKPDVSDISVQSKFEDLGRRIEAAIASGDYEKISAMANKVKEYRQAGLDAHGEFGPENLAFKILRTQGLIKKLYNARNEAKDRLLSLDERRKKKKKKTVRYGYSGYWYPGTAYAGQDHPAGTEGGGGDGGGGESVQEDLNEVGSTPDGVNPSTTMILSDVDSMPSDEEILKDFIDFCVKELKIEQLPRVRLRRDPQWPTVHKTFGRYSDDAKTLEVAWGGRHIMDVLRTVAHELTHKHQHERDGDRMGPDAGETGSPYENEANARAGVLMRDWGRLHPEHFDAGPAQGLEEGASGYIPTRAQARDPRYSMALTVDIKPGQVGKEANKLKLKTDRQGYPQIARANGLFEQLMAEYEQTKETIQTPVSKTDRAAEDYYRFVAGKARLGRPLTRQEQEFLKMHNLKKQLAEFAPGGGSISPPVKPPKNDGDRWEDEDDDDDRWHPRKRTEADLHNPLGEQIKALLKKKAKIVWYPWADREQNTQYRTQAVIRQITGEQIIDGRHMVQFKYSWRPWYKTAKGMELGGWRSDQTFIAPNSHQHLGLVPIGPKTYELQDMTKNPDWKDPRSPEEIEWQKRFDDLDESVDLDEVRMSPSALEKFATSKEAQGIRAGFEAELIFRDTQGESEEMDPEPDYDADERAYSIQQVIEFFENDEWGYGLSNRQRNRLEEELDEAYMTWRDEQMMRDFADEAEDLVRKVIEDEEWDWDDAVRNQLDDMGLSNEEIEAAMAAGNKAPRFTRLSDQDDYSKQNAGYDNYLKAYNAAESILDDLVEESVREQDKYWDQAVDDYRDNYAGDDDSFFEDVGLRWMSDIANNYDLDWPVWNMDSRGNDGSRDWEEIGGSLNDAVGMPVKVSSNYHSTTRREGQWIVEPDSSLSPDDPSDETGLEIVSPPMPLLMAIEKLKAVTDWANDPARGNAYTNSSTGLHMGMSLPVRGGDVDYVKLILFMGDKYVLEKFGRSANNYAASALEKLRQNIKGGKSDPAGVVTLLKHGLTELAFKELQKGVGTSKYTSAHLQNGYIEFRSPGGDWLAKADEEIGILENTMMRFAQAMQIAGDPGAERQEYAKKLYKLVTEGNDQYADQLRLFSEFSAGTIDKEQLKKQWAEKTIGTEKKQNQRWKLYQKVNGTWTPVPAAEWNGYTEDQVKTAVWSKYGREALDSGEYQLVNMGEQAWEVYDVKTGKTLEVVKGKSKGEVADAVYDKYVDQGIGFQVRPYEDPATLTPRAKLAKRIVQPKKQPEPQEVQARAPNGVPYWNIVDRDTGHVVHTVADHDRMTAYRSGMTWLRSVGAESGYEDRFGVEPKMIPDSKTTDAKKDSADLQRRLGIQDVDTDVAQNFEPRRQNYELVSDEDPDRVLHRMPNATADEVRAWIAQQEQGGMPPGFLRTRIVAEAIDPISGAGAVPPRPIVKKIDTAKKVQPVEPVIKKQASRSAIAQAITQQDLENMTRQIQAARKLGDSVMEMEDTPSEVLRALDQAAQKNGYRNWADVKASPRSEHAVMTVAKLANTILRTTGPHHEKIFYKNKTDENFADGKVKGKSRPGRVKRAGASCAGSVTDLRRRAKNSSGEKAKMYHWCANMKSGKKK
jgi:hypothetical protein